MLQKLQSLNPSSIQSSYFQWMCNWSNGTSVALTIVKFVFMSFSSELVNCKIGAAFWELFKFIPVSVPVELTVRLRCRAVESSQVVCVVWWRCWYWRRAQERWLHSSSCFQTLRPTSNNCFTLTAPPVYAPNWRSSEQSSTNSPTRLPTLDPDLKASWWSAEASQQLRHLQQGIIINIAIVALTIWIL